MNLNKIILFILLNAIVFNLYAKEPGCTYENDVIVIRHFYVMSNSVKSIVKIYKSNNQIESIELPPITDDDKNNSFMELRNIVQKFISEGYTITASNEAAFVSMGNKIITTYILEKK